jgi:hypothetical protein
MGLIEFILSLNAESVPETPEPPIEDILFGDDDVLWGDSDTTFDD